MRTDVRTVAYARQGKKLGVEGGVGGSERVNGCLGMVVHYIILVYVTHTFTST